MSKFDIGANSEKLAIWYRDVPITIDEFNRLEGKITKECKKYLIGKTCVWEKNKRCAEERVKDIYTRLGQVFGYVEPSLKRLVNYAHAIDHFQRIVPDIASDILAGRTRLSLKDAIVLARMDVSDIRVIMERLACEETPATVIFKEQIEESKTKKRRGRPKRKYPKAPAISIKDTPPYDPDAQAVALSFTIPSWVNAIDKIFMSDGLHKISKTARNKLAGELTALKDISDIMIAMLSDDNGKD